ncbi:lia operon protein LiaG [Paenibacillus sp. UNCCL117]|uniref:DUF4097 family beta strand repeat-containing protein n=1 Tax=unclassified Paenibacillus TaxID=185978 RepID=UPI00087E5158|nr:MULTISPECIES: DUF4097 family beta strand repeat-containing protein [unclassified Paenibacillus]SDD48635.1 lia operon protein LiaG [Paenibacillus sp. cl123]SFW50205.1 lia operon protein LiaG [Paenibacillus sp. UNCCL117]
MKKSFGYILIAAGVLIALFVLNPVRLWSGGDFLFRAKDIQQEQSLDASRVRTVRVESGSTELEIVPGSSDQIRVWLSGKASAKFADGLKLKVEPEGDTARISVDVPDDVGVGIQRLDLELRVEVPETGLKLLNVESSSGDVQLERINADQLQIRASSGNIHLEQLKGEKVLANASSGNVQAVDIQATTIDLQTRSGNLYAEDYKAAELKFETTSGDVKLEDGQAIVSGHTDSGRIRLEADELTRNTDLKGSSGDVIVALSQQPKSLKLDYRGGSGEGKVEWEGMSYTIKQEEGKRIEGSFGSGDIKLNVRTNSGEFRLEKR